MKLLVVFTIFVFDVLAMPQNSGSFRFSAVVPDISGHQIEFIETTSEITEAVIIEPSKQTVDGFSQCVYDFQGNRLNKGCPMMDRPPMCQKGFLVQTLVGNDFEMCCCNFSNIS
jgi:hypothetical protein